MNRIFCIALISILAFQAEGRYISPAAGTPSVMPVLPDTVFPKPVGQRNMLFYIQRTPNINTIIYSLNFDEKNQLDSKEPVHVYWIRYAEEGQQAELSYIQRRYAYGLKSKDLGNNKYELRFVSYKNLPFYLYKSPKDNQFHVYATVNKKEIILHRIYLQIEGGSFWLPEVKWVEVKGTDPVTGREMTERFKP